MKNRKLIYILGPLTIAIWGAIAYNIYSHMRSPDVPEENYIFHKLNKEKNITDSGYALLGNYRDPFASGSIKTYNEHSQGSMKVTTHETVKQNTWVNWPNIEYKGTILNENKKIALIRIEGSNYLLKEGDETKQIKLLKMFNDSIIMFYQKNKKTFYKNR